MRNHSVSALIPRKLFHATCDRCGKPSALFAAVVIRDGIRGKRATWCSSCRCEKRADWSVPNEEKLKCGRKKVNDDN